MKLQDRLRSLPIMSNTAKEGAAEIDRLESREKALVESIRDLEIEITKRARFRDSERHPTFVAALQRARALLEDK